MTEISFSPDDFAKALEQDTYNPNLEPGQVVRGKVDQHTSDGAYIDIGGKSPGFIPLRESALESVTNIADSLPLNEEFDFLIIRAQNAEGQVTLSRRQLAVKKAWENLAEIAESGKSVQMRVTGINRGGVTGDVEGLRGFIPRSHLMEKDDLDALVGQLLTANFLEVDPERNKLVLSQRQAAQAVAMGNLTSETVVTGKVMKIQPYGVFVEISGVTGLLHITQVSGTHIDSLNTVFKIGQEIQVVIVEIDEYKNRVSLSTKILESYPGELLENMDAVMTNAQERFDLAKTKAEAQK